MNILVSIKRFFANKNTVTILGVIVIIAILYFGYNYRVYLGNVLKSQIIPLIILNLSLGFFVGGIDNAAHIGGMLGGFFVTQAVGLKYKTSKFESFNGYIVLIVYLLFLGYMGLVR